MMRTDAPKDFEGRGEVNFARTTPELPAMVSLMDWFLSQDDGVGIITVGTCDLAPDHPDLGTALLLVSAVDVRDLLPEVEPEHLVSIASSLFATHHRGHLPRGLRVIDALNLDEARLGVGDVLATGVAHMATPVKSNSLAPEM